MDAGERVLRHLGDTTRFGDIRRLRQVGSTNEALVEGARAGAAEGTVVVADLQTAGRGRLGRGWEAPAGTALITSILLRPEGLAPGRLHLVTAAVGLAAADACEGLAGVRPELKWPNDLLVGPAKLAGVLAELVTPPEGSRPAAVVVGIGLNISASPPGATDLAAAGSEPAPGVLDLLAALLEGLEARCGRWEAVAGEYAARCATIGRDVRVESIGGEVREGRATGVDDDGRLIVSFGPGATEVLAAGDVHHLRPAGGGRW